MGVGRGATVGGFREDDAVGATGGGDGGAP